MLISIKNDRNWVRKWQSFCVDSVKTKRYYTTGYMRGEVVNNTSYAYYTRKTYGMCWTHTTSCLMLSMILHRAHVPQPSLSTSVILARQSKGESPQIIYKTIIPADVGVRGQADLIDLQFSPDNGYKIIIKLKDYISKFVFLSRSGPR